MELELQLGVGEADSQGLRRGASEDRAQSRTVKLGGQRPDFLGSELGYTKTRWVTFRWSADSRRSIIRTTTRGQRV